MRCLMSVTPGRDPTLFDLPGQYGSVVCNFSVHKSYKLLPRMHQNSLFLDQKWKKNLDSLLSNYPQHLAAQINCRYDPTSYVDHFKHCV